MTTSKIDIRGWGAVTTLGWSARKSAENLLAGKVPAGDFCTSSHLINRELKAYEITYTGNPLEKAWAMIDSALTEAFSRAKLTAAEIAESCLLVGTTGGLFIRNEYEFTEIVRQNPGKETPPITCRNRGPGEVADAIAQKYGINGMIMTFSMACVSSSHALVVAAQLIEQKKVRRAIVVGFEPLLNLTLQGFASLLLYDDEQCRPFCANRSGMQIGEASAAVIMEASSSSSKIKSTYRFAGGYLFNDNNSLTSAGVDGELAGNVIGQTLTAAQISPAEIVAIKAHGTGTRDNDLSEGRGLTNVFGNNLPPVVSLKGAIGHTLGAAGAVETALWLSCLEEGMLPKSFGFTQIDPDLGFAPSQINIP
ncbi:MAG: beta-ketoacyl synthase N-terminal-like domain-containing protein, partial [Deltaproteobacteria bacterium]